MRQSALLLSLTLGLFLLVPPVYAVNYTGETVLEWNTLKFSGIPITTTGKFQTQIASITSTRAFQEVDLQTWKPHTLALSVPQTATAISTADSSQISGSFNTLSSTGDVRGGVGTTRDLDFTALDTGKLTISIAYSQQETGQSSLPSGLVPVDTASILTSVPSGGGHILELFDTAHLLNSSGGGHQSGTLRITESFYRGEQVAFSADADSSVMSQSAVPLPDMLWPTLVGMIGIAFWAERRRRQAGLTR